MRIEFLSSGQNEALDEDPHQVIQPVDQRADIHGRPSLRGWRCAGCLLCCAAVAKFFDECGGRIFWHLVPPGLYRAEGNAGESRGAAHAVKSGLLRPGRIPGPFPVIGAFLRISTAVHRIGLRSSEAWACPSAVDTAADVAGPLWNQRA